MADPLTVIGAISSVISLIEFSDKVLTRLNEYRKAGSEMPPALASLNSQLPLLINILEQSKRGLENDEIQEDSRKALVPSLAGCREQVEKLDRILAKLAPTSGEKTLVKFGKGIRSMWKESDIDQINEEIQRYVSNLTFYCAWSSSNLRPRNDEEIGRIQGWLAAPDFTVNFRKALKLRVDGTGAWFLDSAKFQHWKTEPTSVLWLYGSAGSGKTILSSGIIDHLQQECSKTPSAALAYFFFDFNDTTKQDPSHLLKSLLSQLLEKCPRIPEKVRSLYTGCGKSGRSPSNDEILTSLTETIAMLPAAYIVIDALDECRSLDALFDALGRIVSHNGLSTHMVMTSRREVEIEDGLEFVPSRQRVCLESDVVDEDIRTYVRERFKDDKSLRRWKKDPQMQKEIEDTLSSQANGMFRWAACQVDSVSKCLNRKMVQKTLKDLPKDLNETYSRILCSIDEAYHPYAVTMLRWLAFAPEPMQMKELLEVTGIDYTVGEFDSEEVLTDAIDVSRICSSLIRVGDGRLPLPDSSNVALSSSGTHSFADESKDVSNTPTPGLEAEAFDRREEEMKNVSDDGRSPESVSTIDEEDDSVYLAHFSVKEYLLSEHIAAGPASAFALRFGESHDILARSAILYLLRFENITDDDFDELPLRYPLAFYAAWVWYRHVRALECASIPLSEPLKGLIMRMFNDKSPVFELWTTRLYQPSDLYNANQVAVGDSRDRWRTYERQNPFYAACATGVSYAIDQLVETWAPHLEAKSGRFGTALQAAIVNGHGGLVKMLLDRGSDPNTHAGVYEFALHSAAVYGTPEQVRMLLEKGAAVNAKGEVFGTALIGATLSGEEDSVDALLEHGANADEQAGQYGSALAAALIGQHKNILKKILRHGVEVNVGTPLNYRTEIEEGAAFTSGKKSIGMIKKRTSDFDGWGQIVSLLTVAAANGDADIVQALLEHGAVELDATALHAACELNGGNIPLRIGPDDDGATGNSELDRTVAVLLKHNLALDRSNRYTQYQFIQAFKLACLARNYKGMKTLVQYGAGYTEDSDFEHDLTLSWADLLTKHLKNGLDPNSSIAGKRLLESAALYNRDLAAVKTLLEFGAIDLGDIAMNLAYEEHESTNGASPGLSPQGRRDRKETLALLNQYNRTLDDCTPSTAELNLEE